MKDEDYQQHPNNVYRGSSRASTRSTATTASGLSASPQHTVIEIRREPREPPRKQRV